MHSARHRKPASFPPQPARENQGWFLGSLLVLATLLAYWPALRGGFVWDDDAWTTRNPNLLRDFSGLLTLWRDPAALQQYYPLTGSTFWLDYHLWGFWTLPYHVENVLLHAGAALLFWRLLRRLQVPGAWLAGAIFALHPVMVESAAWITERKNVLSLVLYLAALLAYGRFTGFWEADLDEAGAAHQTPRRRWGAYALAFLLFLGAFLAKATAFSLPAVLLLVAWWKRGHLRWRADVLPALPFFGLTLGLGLGTAWLENHHVGATGPDWALSFPERCLIAGRAFWFYLGKLLWPAHLCFVYPRWLLNARSFAQWLWPVTAAGTLLALWLLRRRIGRGPAAAAFFFVGTLFPVLGFMNAYGMRFSFVWDHWVYLSSLGIVALSAGLVAGTVERLRVPALLRALAAVLLPVLGVLTWQQSGLYSGPETLWRTTLAANPTAFLAHHNLAVILLDRGQIDESINHLQQAVAIQPAFAQAHNNLGRALRLHGQTDLAIASFKTAAQLEPNYAPAYSNLGDALLEKGQVSDAISQFRKALQLDPANASLLNSLAFALLRNGQGSQALALLQKNLTLHPGSAEAHNILANLLLQSGRVDDAIASSRKALELQPDYAPAHSSLGRALLQKRQLSDALSHFQRAAQLSPASAEVQNDLAGALLQAGQFDQARLLLQKTLELHPNFPAAHTNLALALFHAGQLNDAISHFQQALALQPNNAPVHSQLGQLLLRQGRVQETLAHYQAALALQPDDLSTLNNLAWVLATFPDPSARNGPRAVELARRALQLSGGANLSVLDTLAAAYAEAGRFPEATATAQRALALASAQTNSASIAPLLARIRLYHAGCPLRDSGYTGD